MKTSSDKALANPFKGLHFYTEEDRNRFFGRTREVAEFLRLIRRDRLSVLFARSGLGKTSLLRAGVIPRLRQENLLPVIVRVDYSESSLPPVQQVLTAVVAAASADSIEMEDKSASAAAYDEGRVTLWEFFHRYRFWSLNNDPIIPVLILDQFEEVFTLGKQCLHTSDFLVQLADLVENRMPRSAQDNLEASGRRPDFDTRASNYKVVLTLREDYLAKLDSLRPSMPAVMRNRFGLDFLDGHRAVDIVLSVGRQWISEAVAQAIAAVVAGAGASGEQSPIPYQPELEVEPAYLSVMCYELFQRMTELGKDRIDASLVAEEQGNILDEFYQRCFSGLDSATRIFVEDRLLTPTGFRISAPLAEARQEGISSAELNALVESRLLRFEDRLGATHVELSHDLLIGLVQNSRDRRRAEAEREADRQREELLREQLRQSHRRIGFAVAVIALLISGIGYYLYGWVLPYQSYCRGFTKQWGMIHPVGPLPASAVAHRSWTLRVTSQGRFGNIYRAETVDASGRLTPRHTVSTLMSESESSSPGQEKESRYEFVFDRQGSVVYEVAWDRSGHMVWGFEYAPRPEPDSSDTGWLDGLTRWFADERPRFDSAKATFIGSDGYPKPQGGTTAEFVEIHYDPNGYEARYFYKDRQGKDAPGPEKAYGREMKYDELGRLVKLTSLNRMHKPMNDEAGNAGLEFAYSVAGDPVAASAFDAEGAPTLLASGVYRSETRYDEWGREKERRYFDLGGHPVRETNRSNAHLLRVEYDERGNTTKIQLYGENENPISAGSNQFEFSAHEKRMTYDRNNHLLTVTYFGQNGQALAEPAAGWHGYRLEYDARGFTSAQCFFDRNGHTTKLKTANFHCQKSVNNDFGQPIEIGYFDERFKPVTNNAGFHRIKYRYDDDGNIEQESYFDVNGRPAADRSSKAHKVVRRYNRFRKPLVINYFGDKGQPISNSLGFHRFEQIYNDYGLVRDMRWYDHNGRPCKGPDGVHHIQLGYDSRGLKTRTKFKDEHGQATEYQGIYEAQYEYNDKRQEIRHQAFGLHGKPAEDAADGSHLVLHDYDKRGRETRISKLRADGSPNLIRELKIATRTRIWDKKNRWIEQAFYDERDRLVNGPNGSARETVVYQPDGALILASFGANNQRKFNTIVGYAEKRVKPDGSIAYYGADGSLIEGPQGYAEYRVARNEAGRKMEAFFGPGGSLVIGPGGYHRSEIKPGSAKEKIRYFDTENRAIPRPGPGTAIPVFYITFEIPREIISEKPDLEIKTNLIGVQAGLQAGDVLWRYGQWSYSRSLSEERSKGTRFDSLPRVLFNAFLAERDRKRNEKTVLTVIRHGKITDVPLPPLHQKELGIVPDIRLVPIDDFNAWLSMD